MSSSDIIIPFTVCVLAGFILAVVELFQTFGRWIGPYWRNRYVIALTILNIVTAAVVYAFLRYALSIENTIWLAIITGITFHYFAQPFHLLSTPGPGQPGYRRFFSHSGYLVS
jgi:hypothetical protein